MGASCCDANRSKGEEEVVERSKKRHRKRLHSLLATPVRPSPRVFSQNELFIVNEILKQRNKNMMPCLREAFKACYAAKQGSPSDFALKCAVEERKRKNLSSHRE